MIPVGLALEPPSPEAANAVDDLVEQARRAADAGMASLWQAQMYDTDALTAVALIGRQVRGVTLGTAVTTIHSRHPIAMSSQAKTAQAAVGGRLVLGWAPATGRASSSGTATASTAPHSACGST